ncbi:o-succinylbenzoate synthase [Candidatus Aquiluna sp. UB-MaderosW2red]|uniref:o-succinylbenzoate synthase n=1 Tax=Candidatus Aquiluna sp. UB-MaderosW2red TaxID=1855377 RepID=UPI000875DA77|nr:o-succinylbenzoate synthase [Candidatus Aquiluna sp. UB-MaderosW2red]SCX02492.1 O-succinylbenzoate synthase [Candidatus Aquiluna sp. UB-MaderosW2red]
MPQDLITDIAVVRIPMLTTFRGLAFREMLIFRGSERFSEFSPFLEYEDQESAIWLKSSLSWANDPLPKAIRSKIPINATLPAVSADQVERVLQGFGDFESVKIKVAETGQDFSQDLERIHKVRELYPTAKFRIDANGGYSVAQALELAKLMAGSNLEYLEQPVATIPEMVELHDLIAKADLEVKIAADESIRKAQDPLEVARLGACDIAVIKVAPMGGVEKALEIANKSGLEIVVSSALESSIGIAQGLALAASIPTLNYPCGLGTLNLMAGDIVKNPLRTQNGFLEFDVPEIDSEMLEKYRAPKDREEFWIKRLERCLELL